jgi:hypothetical protein
MGPWEPCTHTNPPHCCRPHSQVKYLSEAVTAPTWAAIGALSRESTALGELLRAGDISGGAAALLSNGTADADVIAEATVSPLGIVVTLINLANDGGYTDLDCGVGLVQHWRILPHNIPSLAVTIPAGLCLRDSFELSNATVLPGTVVPPFPAPGGLCGPAVLRMEGVALGVTWPGVTRTLVFAAQPGLRAAVAAELAPWEGRATR